MMIMRNFTNRPKLDWDALFEAVQRDLLNLNSVDCWFFGQTYPYL